MISIDIYVSYAPCAKYLGYFQNDMDIREPWHNGIYKNLDKLIFPKITDCELKKHCTASLEAFLQLKSKWVL